MRREGYLQMTTLRRFSVLACVCALAACGSREEPAPAAEAPSAPPPALAAAPMDHAEHAATDAPLAPLPAVPTGARVFFQTPAPDMTVRGLLADGKIEVPVKMGAEGISVKPAGAVEAGSGHHHIIVDGEATATGEIVPKDETHLHFGQGQTDAVVALAPGKHKLTMQFADGMHRSYGPALSATIEITIEAEGGEAAADAPKGPATEGPATGERKAAP